jgi:hypothetical protein
MALLYSKPAHAFGVPVIDKSSREYANWIARTRYRANKMRPLPPPLILPKEKVCRRCSQSKPLSEFDTYRMRICKACDGLPIR